MRFDIHTNIGQFPGSKKGVPVYCSVDNMVEYLIRNDITHHICLYPYNGYHLLEDLQLKLPDVQHYGLQCVMGVDEDNPTDIKNLQLDILDGNKTLCKGVKIASHRGWWLIKNKIQSGIDYGSQSRIIRKHILDVLPDNCIISWHLQGDPICNSGSTPMHIARLAGYYPHIKFILNHCGDYGQGKFSTKPKELITEKYQMQPTFRYAHSQVLIQSCITYAMHLPNCWIDSSIYIPNKNLLYNSNSWCIGSDYPFGEEFNTEYQKFKKQLGTQVDNQMYSTLNWTLNLP